MKYRVEMKSQIGSWIHDIYLTGDFYDYKSFVQLVFTKLRDEKVDPAIWGDYVSETLQDYKEA